MQPTKNNVTIAHENGDVEQSHHQFKKAVDQALRVRASRDFPSREAYERFLADLVRTRNRHRETRNLSKNSRCSSRCLPLHWLLARNCG